jgi:hypothetical protein
MNATFDPQILTDDLCEVQRIDTQFFAVLDVTRGDRPAERGAAEWTLHEALAHVCVLNGDGLAAIKHALQVRVYVFRGLDDRLQFNAFNGTTRDPAALIALRVSDQCAKAEADGERLRKW